MAARARWVAAYLFQLDTFGVKLVPFVDVTDARKAQAIKTRSKVRYHRQAYRSNRVL